MMRELAFWIGALCGLFIGTLTATACLMFFMGASERMSREEWMDEQRRDERAEHEQHHRSF